MKALYQAYLNSNGISTDSRTIKPGQIFVALKGPAFDGHKFVSNVVEAGAKGIVVENAFQESGLPKHVQVFKFEDTLKALQDLALIHRENFNGICFAITGSNGKTTTKELLHVVLSKKFKVHATPGNLNNHIGVPLTILCMSENTNFLLLEMGANHQGEIAELCAIGRPKYGLVTNVANAHLEGFGGLQGVIKAKGELYNHICDFGTMAFYDANSPHLKGMIPCSKKTAYQDIFTQNAITIEGKSDASNQNHLTIHAVAKHEQYTCKTQLTGLYNLQNIEAAIAIGLYFDIPLSDILGALEDYRVKNMRSQIFNNGNNTIILDAYNANPTSMAAALENLKHFDCKKMAVLGDMLELGDESTKFHHEILNQALEIDDITVLTVGPLFGEITSDNASHFHCENSMVAAKLLKSLQPENTTILFKGSRGVGLEKAYELWTQSN